MTHIYCVQWIDHGGPYHEPRWEQQVPTVLRQMGYDPDVMLLNMGGLKLKNREDGCNLFGYIETSIEIPRLDGLSKPSARWVDSIKLWFYTFKPNLDEIEEFFDIYDFEDIFYTGDEEIWKHQI